MCWRPLQVLLRKPSGLSCEIVSDLCPNPLSHDWHVQPNFQRPNHVPPERRAFSPVRLHLAQIRLSSKPFKHTARNNPRQRKPCTEFPPDFHNGKFHGRGQPPPGVRSSKARQKAANTKAQLEDLNYCKLEGCHSESAKPKRKLLIPSRSTSAQRYSLPPRKQPFFGARRSGRQKIEKRSKLWRSL